MKKFYLFLDIDGVLWDWAYLKKEIAEGRIKKGGIAGNFKPESINSLNYLIRRLSEKYDVKLVISSSWRKLRVWILIEEYLINKGLPIIDVTSRLNNRGEEIRENFEEFVYKRN